MPERARTVAVVDDEEDVRVALQRLLRSAGFDVFVYGSGKSFLEDLASRPPDCLVLDLHMPGMTGFDVMDVLAAQEAGIPVIAITGNDTPSSRSRALASGVSLYLSKPVDDEVLINTIDELTLPPERAEGYRTPNDC